MKIRSEIFGCLQSGTIDLLIGSGYALLDGGYIRRVNVDLVPLECRMPNTKVWVTIKNKEIIAIEKLTSEEIEK